MEPALLRVRSVKEEVKFKKNQVVYTQGGPADCVFQLRAGGVKVTYTSPEGKEAIVALLRPGEFFGEECLSGNQLRFATVTALTETTASRLTKEEVFHAIQEDRDFAEVIMRHLLRRNIQMQEDLADHMLNSLERRLARLLLTLANCTDGEELDPIAPGITQEMLAAMLGSSRTNVNFFMNRFRQQGFIDYNGQITVKKSLMTVVSSERPKVARNQSG